MIISGTADCIIQYADEDTALVNDGKFAMEDLPNVDGSGSGIYKFEYDFWVVRRPYHWTNACLWI